jgi:hypothetical protein
MIRLNNVAGPALKVVDTSSERQDLARRKELKFVVAGADVAKVQRLLEVNCRPVVHNDPISTVRSVYFDDVQLSACQANIDGLGRREKLRFRWYDTLAPNNEAFIEVKWRQNRITGKHRAHVQSEEPLANYSFRKLLASLQAKLPESFQPAFARYAEPIVLVEYKRRHFISPDKQIRLTIDFDLRYYDQTSRQSFNTKFGQPLPGLVIVEAKVPVGGEGELASLLHPFSSRVGGCSKYVLGCRMLNLIPASVIDTRFGA